MYRLLEIVLDGEGTVGGTQKHVEQLVAGVDPERYRADVVTWDIPQFVESLSARGIDTLAVTSSRILDAGLVRRLTEHITAGGYDLVHAHGHRAGLIGRVAAIRAGVPAIVWTCHLAFNKADGNAVLSTGYAAALRWLTARTGATIAVSNSVRDWLLSRGIDPNVVEVIYNCVDLDEFRPRPAKPETVKSLLGDIAPAGPIVGTVARLSEQKGLDVLIEAARIVIAARPDVRFVVVGGGPWEHRLLEQCRELGVSDKVVFAGQRGDIPDVIATFDVAVLPSRWEGFSYVPLEFMASRKPVVCSDIAPFLDLVRDGDNGLTFPTESAAELADAILRLAGDPDEAERLAEAGYRRVTEEFALPVMQSRTTEVYERLLQAKAGQ